MMADSAFGFLAVGKCYDQWKTGMDGLFQLNYTENDWRLVVGFNKIRPDEVEDFRRGAASITFTVIDGCLFLLAKFGRQNWLDTPYEPRLSNETMNFRSFEGDLGAPLTVIAVDTSNGEVKSLRMIGLGHVLSNHLHESCAKLQKNTDFDLSRYRSKINKIYQRYPQSADMVKTANPADLFIVANLT